MATSLHQDFVDLCRDGQDSVKFTDFMTRNVSIMIIILQKFSAIKNTYIITNNNMTCTLVHYHVFLKGTFRKRELKVQCVYTSMIITNVAIIHGKGYHFC